MKIDRTHWEHHKKGRVPMVSLPKKQLDEILDQIEELEDLAAVRRWKESQEETIPAEVVFACMDAKHNGERLRAVRKFRNLTREQLAERAGGTGANITMIETGKRKGSLGLFSGLAVVLNVPLEMLVK